MMTMKGKILIAVAVIAVLGIGGYRWKDKLFPAAQSSNPSINVNALKDKLNSMGSNVMAAVKSTPKEEVDINSKLLAGTNSVSLIGESAIPPVTAVSAYDKTTKNGKMLVKFPINVWPGWASIIAANNGMAANEDSLFYKKYGFFVELSLVDDPVMARDLFASGHSHVLWGTLDMIALFAPALSKDSRTIPIVAQAIDNSNGGDGVVSRNDIKSINDFRMKNGKKRKVVLAQNSPSHYFFMVLLINAGIDPAEIDFRWTKDAPSAAKLFVQDVSFDAFVGWSPDIYTVTDSVPGTRLVVTSSAANNVIFDVWAVRNDFMQDHPDIVEKMIRCILEGVEIVRKDPKLAAKYLNGAFNIPVEDCEKMIGKDGGIASGDAHLLNYRENYKFFCDPMNPVNFEAIWNKASTIYQTLGAIDAPVVAAKVKASKFLLGMANDYKEVQDLSQPVFSPNMIFKNLEAGESTILSKSVQIRFESGKWDLNSNYDTNIPSSLVEIGTLAGNFGNAYIVIEGNTDGSMKGLVPSDAIRKLSYDRAESVKKSILAKYPNFDPNKFKVVGNGWDCPLPGCTDSTDKEQNKKNRRTEIKVYPLETE